MRPTFRWDFTSLTHVGTGKQNQRWSLITCLCMCQSLLESPSFLLLQVLQVMILTFCINFRKILLFLSFWLSLAKASGARNCRCDSRPLRCTCLSGVYEFYQSKRWIEQWYLPASRPLTDEWKHGEPVVLSTRGESHHSGASNQLSSSGQ